jgi:hypothetical protein
MRKQPMSHESKEDEVEQVTPKGAHVDKAGVKASGKKLAVSRKLRKKCSGEGYSEECGPKDAWQQGQIASKLMMKACKSLL